MKKENFFSRLFRSDYDISKEEAIVIIDPFYNLFRAEKRDWDKGMDSLRDDWKSYDANNNFRDKEQTREYLKGMFASVPDINVTNLQVQVDGDWICVRSELTGTPSGEFLGEPHTGRSFHIMAVDFNRFDKDGKLAELYHCENWAIAILQLRGQWE